MIYSVIYLLVSLVISAHGKVAISDEQLSLSDIEDNVIDAKHIHIHLPTISPDTNKVDAKSDNNIEDNNIFKLPTSSDNPINVTEITNNTIDNETLTPENKIDNGTALILTPFIKQGRLSEARDACKVDPEMFLGIESYSGFLTVNETYGSNLFFWYFPIENRSVSETPWIIWMQGGPGASSMTGLFDEIGPFSVTAGATLIKNQHSWRRDHSLLFIENPVGTGFSYTMSADGFAQDMDTYGAHLYTALSQFLEIFPELRTAPLFVAGESYAGKYVPALAMQIHRHSEQGNVNLQGMIMGNAYVDPGMISHMTRPFYYFGLLEHGQIEIVRPLLDGFQQDIAANRSVEAKYKWNHLITVLLLLSHQKHAYNFLQDELSVGKYLPFLRKAEVKRALHVGDIQFSFVNMTVNSKLNPDFLSSAKPMFEELLDRYRVLTYCGQLDQMLSCVLTSENYRTWKWSGSKDFLDSTRYPYIFNGRLSGYHKSGGRLTEVVVRGAGHMAPLDAPAPVQHLVARWVRGQPLSHGFGLLDGSFVQEYIRNSSATKLHYL